MRKIFSFLFVSAVLALSLAACGGGETDRSSTPQPTGGDTSSTAQISDQTSGQLTVRFGTSAPFTLYLEDNETAAAIARHVGTADWRLPIYRFDDYEGWGNKLVLISAGN